MRVFKSRFCFWKNCFRIILLLLSVVCVCLLSNCLVICWLVVVIYVMIMLYMIISRIEKIRLSVSFIGILIWLVLVD